jgi:purine nucleoside phosphorylase
VRLYQSWGGDVIGQTVCPEAELACAIGARFAVLNVVANYGEGLGGEGGDSLAPELLERRYEEMAPRVAATMLAAVRAIPDELATVQPVARLDSATLKK